jgi:ABC-type glycerol-3-phosphate transport system substrate-binding protein
MGDAYDWKHLGEAMDPADLGVYIGPKIEQDFPLEGVGPGPLSDSIDATTGTAYAISNTTDAPDEALAFAQFMTGPETVGAILDAGSYPAAKSFDTSAMGSPALDQLVELAGEATGACWVHLDSAVEPALIAGVQLLLAGETTPEAAGQMVEDALIDVRP